MMGNPTTVLFDMGGVLFSFDPARRLRYISELCGVPEGEVQDRVFATDFDLRCETGDLGPDQSLLEFNRLCGAELDMVGFQRAILSAFTANDILIGLVKELSSHCVVAGFTNNGVVARDGLMQLHPDISPMFGSRLFCSADFGACKPEPAAFDAVLTKLQRNADEVLFVDDSEDNARAALGMGFHVHRFFDSVILETDLRSYGLL